MLQVYLKPTNYCNVGCDFCYLPDEVRSNKKRMTTETLEHSLQLIRDLAAREGHDRVSILYHGGEPLTLASEVLFEFSDAVRQGLVGLEVQESIQTSLIPLRPGHIAFLRERCGAFIGSSIDFSGRTINGSSSRYVDLWMDKVQLARDNGLEVGPVMVPTRGELGRAPEIYAWFKSNGFKHFNIERYNSQGGDENRPDNREHATFLRDLFDISMADLRQFGSCVTNNAVGASIAGVLNGQPGERWGGTCQRGLSCNKSGRLSQLMY